MIRMSRLIALLTLLASGAAGCESNHACTLIGCLDGVVVSFNGLDAHASYEIDVSAVSTAEVASIMTCTVAATDAGSQQLACTSSEAHSEFGTSVQIRDSTLGKLQITVSSGGTQVAQQTFDVTYQSREINGSGCGVCTSASVTMTVP
jgi:hypothetical protein